MAQAPTKPSEPADTYLYLFRRDHTLNLVCSSFCTDNAGMRKAHDEDPLNLKKFTLGWAKQGLAVQSHVVAMTEKTLNLPLLFLYADADKVADPIKNRKLGEELVSEDKTVVVKKGQYHEVLNEVERGETMATIAEWVLKRI